MTKKKDTGDAGLFPDLFSGEEAQSTDADVTIEPETAKEDTFIEVVSQEPQTESSEASDGAEVDPEASAGDPEQAVDEVSGEGKTKAKGAVPEVLCDGEPPMDDDGSLTLARYAARAYLEYALSVVKSRALPDVFDGMKPVQRRILYAMDRMRLAPPAKAVKCARVVGDVLGKYHPHGDQAAYDAMVRMAQDFSLRYPLVDGEGNFGSRDGDGPAAMRYTEARLTAISELVLSELDAEDVEFVPNYDGAFKEPVCLPAKLPFVLLNGASGIAVGMATEIPSHNLRETAEAVLLLLRHPEATLDDILAVMPGPDFPGGAQIISSAADIRQTYLTGRGSLRVRARYHFEELQRGQWQLVVDELPPAANAELVLSQIEEITNPKPKTGKKALSAEQQQTKAAMLAVLDGVRNECDKDTPVRLVFEPKNSKVNRDQFVQMLLSQTSLECNAPMNLVMIGIDGKPAQKGLVSILSEWVQARLETVRRRTQARLNKVNARLHILEGRVKAIDNIDLVIEIVRFEEHPKEVLMAEFDLSAEQAEDILELRLRQLANLEYERVQSEIEKLDAERITLEKILSDEKTLKNVVAKETREAAKKFGDERRTLIEEAKKASSEPVRICEPVTVVISEKGFVRCRTGHGHDLTIMNFKMGDKLACGFECESDDSMIVFGKSGRVYSVAVSQLPSARGDGMPVTSFIDLEAGETIVGYAAGPADRRVFICSKSGFGFVCSIKNLTARVRSGKAFMNLEPGDEVLAHPRMIFDRHQYLAVLNEDQRLLVFPLSEIRTLPGGGKGVTLMGLDAGESVLAAIPVTADGVQLLGATKRSSESRSKVLVRGEFERHVGRRGRRGKPVIARFAADRLEEVLPAEVPETSDEEAGSLF